MNYLIYKITNKLNNKIYVGKHKTDFMFDDYFGSGLLLGRAIEKHGKENFTREILFECKTEEEMNQKEADIVDEDFIARPDTYNIKLGGCGGFDYIHKYGLENSGKPREYFQNAGRGRGRWIKHRWETDPDFGEEMRQKRRNNINLQKFYSNGNSFKGRHHTVETKEQLKRSAIGKHDGPKNGAFGTHWITNGVENKRVSKNLPVEISWRKGRV